MSREPGLTGSKRFEEAIRVCEEQGHIPVDYEISHPIWPDKKIYPGTRMFNGEFLYSYPCERCGMYLSEKEVDSE